MLIAACFKPILSRLGLSSGAWSGEGGVGWGHIAPPRNFKSIKGYNDET